MRLCNACALRRERHTVSIDTGSAGSAGTCALRIIQITDPWRKIRKPNKLINMLNSRTNELIDEIEHVFTATSPERKRERERCVEEQAPQTNKGMQQSRSPDSAEDVYILDNFPHLKTLIGAKAVRLEVFED